MGVKHRGKSRKGNRGKYGPRKENNSDAEQVRALIEKEAQEEKERAKRKAKSELAESRGWTRYTINNSKECLDPYAEHTVRWRLTTSKEPYTQMYKTKKLNHSDMMRMITPGLGLDRLLWVKGFCSNNQHHFCFEWRRGDQKSTEQDGL